jgi:predicted hydrocarbon binding protein
MIDESVTVKGSPVRSLQQFIEGELTPEQREIVLRNLPPEFAKRFVTPVLATESVPVHMLNRFTEEAAKARGEALESFARRAGRQGASEAVKGIYRFFALVMTPAALLGKASQMWSSLYNRGELRVEEQRGNSASIRLRNFPSEVAGCSRITGWIERMAELTKAKNVKIEQTQCFAKGGAYCEWKLSWN